MPPAMEKALIETRETGPRGGDTPEEAPRHHDTTEHDECTRDACRPASRDEMWVRWG